MVKGLDLFRAHFRDFTDQYVLIGGVACDRLFDEAGLDFRATKDLDIVLCVEALDSEFVRSFWKFVEQGRYEHQNKSTGEKQYYRFTKPADQTYPAMLELFSRSPDGVVLSDDAHLTPIPVDQDAESLSAVLLDDDYYECLQQGKRVIDGLSVLGLEYVLAFKARAWLDMTRRKESGISVDSKDLRKRRNDVFQISQAVEPDQAVFVSDSIQRDMRQFIDAMRAETGLDLENLGLPKQSLEEVLQLLESIYCQGRSL